VIEADLARGRAQLPLDPHPEDTEAEQKHAAVDPPQPLREIQGELRMRAEEGDRIGNGHKNNRDHNK
jgi:hypothetical protein